MKNPESTTPTVNNTITPSLSSQQVQDIQRAPGREAYSQANKDLSFLTILASAHLKLEPLSSPDEYSEFPEARVEEKKTPAVSKSSEQKKSPPAPEPANMTPLSATVQSQDNSEVQDALDMLNIDLSKVPSTDLGMLLRLGQGVPIQQTILQNLSPSLLEALPNTHYKSLGVSKGLQDLLETAYKTQRPIRISLSDNAAMILRLGRDGRVSAEFLPNTQAAEAYFRQNMLELQNRLESKQLPYGTLSVRDWRDQQDRKQQQQ